MFDQVKKGWKIKKVFSEFQENDKLDIRKVEEFLQEPLNECDSCDIEAEEFCSEHKNELKDFSMLAEWLNTQLRDQEKILDAAGVDYDKAGKFDMENLRDLFASVEWTEALHHINVKFSEQDAKLKRQLCEELGIEEDKINEMF